MYISYRTLMELYNVPFLEYDHLSLQFELRSITDRPYWI